MPSEESINMQSPSAGSAAPDFALQHAPGELTRLSQYRGRPVALIFYPADFSPVCGDQLTLYNEIMEEFKPFDAQLLAISVDGIWCHQAYAKERKFEFPLLSDFHPHGEVSKRYGVYRPAEGFSERALFVIDREGIIRWSHVSPLNVNPGAAGILQALEELP